ncbi:nitroreductase family protein [Paenibacillus stellifer]|uniref:nitroreductase family protein n=1 Tax=Paenibacillus stellifer TaxID=169760 RepID=UPI001C54F0F6|nr:nitroreductase family protein [Paenibacillus stellifer]
MFISFIILGIGWSSLIIIIFITFTLDVGSRMNMSLNQGRIYKLDLQNHRCQPESPIHQVKECLKCGLCVKECPVYVLELKENGPEEVAAEDCIACGHCVAICPREAIDNMRTPLSNQISSKTYPKLNPEEAENFLRSRRSVRSYKKTPVPREKLTELVRIAHFAPSGHNLQNCLIKRFPLSSMNLKQLTNITQQPTNINKDKQKTLGKPRVSG